MINKDKLLEWLGKWAHEFKPNEDFTEEEWQAYNQIKKMIENQPKI